MSKQEEIKQALAAATPGWLDNGNEIVSKQNPKVGIGGFLKEEDNHLAAKAPEYIAYLLEENEQLEKRNQDLDAWATEGFEENQKLVVEIVRLRKELEEAREEISSLNSDVIELHKVIGADAIEKELKVIKEKNKQETDWKKLYLESERSKKILSDYLNELMYKTPNETISSQIANVLREALGQEGEGNQEEMRHLTPEESESYERSLDKLFNQSDK